MSVSIQTFDFNLGDELAVLNANPSSTGAIVSFVGVVRDNPNGTLKALELEHYPQMTEKVLESLIETAKDRFDILDATVIHRVGKLGLGEQIMMVGVISAHRKEALQATDFIMDFLKSRAPFWKKEITKDGVQWVGAKQRDEDALEQWLD